MVELDFRYFGINPENIELKKRIVLAHTELERFGYFPLRAAWLYYGSVELAAKVIGITPRAYRSFLEPKTISEKEFDRIIKDPNKPNDHRLVIHNRRSEQKLQQAISTLFRSNDDLCVFLSEAASLIACLPHAERARLFSHDIYEHAGESFVRTVEDWKSDKHLECISDAIRLLECYLDRWYLRGNARVMFQGGGFCRFFEGLIAKRKDFEELSGISEPCSVALEIFKEYDAYTYHWEATHAHQREQARLLNNRRRTFYKQIVDRSGPRCASCSCKGSHEIDHIKRTMSGGYTETDNLQLLCKKCHTRKSVLENRE